MTDEPLPPPIESASTTFLQRGASIVASERGLTPRARLLLESLAKDLALSASDFEQAMAILQSGEAVAAKAVDPQRARFREVLKRQLAELPAKILSARHEQTLVSFAVTQLLIAEDAARDDLLQVAQEIGLRRVTFEEALRYVEDVIAQKLADDTTIDPVVQARFISLGRGWGLEPADVTELVRFRLEENAARRRREKMWNVGVVAGAAGALLVVLGVLLFLAARNWLATGTAELATTTDPSAEPASPRRTRLPSWWDTDLTIAITQARNERDDFGPVYEAISSPQPERRAQGYELLIERAAATPFNYATWKPFEPILLGCHALEPDETAATTLRRSWLRVPERVLEQVPPTSEGYQAAIRPLTTAVRGMKESRASASRTQALADDVGRLLRTSLNVASSETDLQRQTLSALAVALLEQLAEGVEKRPDLLSRHYPTLAALARDRVPPEEQARLDAFIAAKAIESTPDTWRSWESILNRGIEARDPLSVLRIIDAFDRCKNEGLRKALASRLFARLGISPAGLPTDQYATAMRKALGAVLPAEANDALRWARLEQQAEIALQAQTPQDDVDLLRATVDLAWQANLAMALAIERSNPGQFDRWLTEGPPSERKTEEAPADETSSATPSGEERLPRDVQDTLDRYMHELGDWQKVDEPRRLSYLHGIAQIAPRVRDIPPLQARQVAGYLLGKKRDQEQSQVMESAAALRGWKQLRIALADGMERATITPDYLYRLVLVFTGQEVRDIESNRGVARRLLLQSTLTELQFADAAKTRNQAAIDLDRHAEELSLIYRERAQLLGSPPSERASATTASSLLRLSVQRLASADNGALDPAARLAELSGVVATSDSQQTVLLQRALVERALEDIARRQPEQLVAAKQMVDEFRRENQAATQVLVQLRNGEATLLRLWLLHQPRERRK
jgi:hypothetical protein